MEYNVWMWSRQCRPTWVKLRSSNGASTENMPLFARGPKNSCPIDVNRWLFNARPNETVEKLWFFYGWMNSHVTEKWQPERNGSNRKISSWYQVYQKLLCLYERGYKRFVSKLKVRHDGFQSTVIDSRLISQQCGHLSPGDFRNAWKLAQALALRAFSRSAELCGAGITGWRSKKGPGSFCEKPVLQIFYRFLYGFPRVSTCFYVSRRYSSNKNHHVWKLWSRNPVAPIFEKRKAASQLQ